MPRITLDSSFMQQKISNLNRAKETKIGILAHCSFNLFFLVLSTIKRLANHVDML